MTFGSNIGYQIIDEIKSLNQKDWEPLETYWIKYYINLGYNLMNIKEKGGSGPSFLSNEAKNKISVALKGRPSPKSTFKRGKDNAHYGVPKKRESVEKVRQALKGIPKKKESIEKGALSRSKTIIQYTLDHIFIKEWISSSEASRILKISKSNITACCKGRYGYKTCGNFKWEYK